MNFLVTGGAGFIGANLTLELEERFPSASITVLDNFSPGTAENLKGFKGRLIKGGVEDEKLTDSLKSEKFDFIYHLAAITDTTVTDDKRMMRVNVDGFKNILKIAKYGNAPVVYASSAGVYGNGPAPMKETQEPHPLNAYALSKSEMEKIALSFTDVGTIGLRYFNVYGPKEADKGKSASMLWQLACRMKGGNPPRIFKYGEQVRDFIYVKDVVSATIQAMEVLDKNRIHQHPSTSPTSPPPLLKGEKGGLRSHLLKGVEWESKVPLTKAAGKIEGGGKLKTVLNVGTGTAVSFNRVIEILNDALGTNFKPDYFDNPYNFYQNHTQADTTLAAETIGFKAKYSIEDGIKDYLKESS